MQDDFTVFWQNNARARALFDDLVARMERGAYDDDFLMQLAAYREAGGSSVHADIFAAQYLLAQGDPAGAAQCGERAFRHRSVNHAVWRVLARAYTALGRYADALVMQGYAHSIYPDTKLELNLSSKTLQQELGRLSVAMGLGKQAPLARSRAYIENDRLFFHHDLFIGEYLPLTMPKGSKQFWVACYMENAFLSDKGIILAEVRRSDWFTVGGHRDFPFDLQKAQEVRGSVDIDVPKGYEVVVPIAGTAPNQEISLQTDTDENITYLGKWAFSYFRLNERTTLHPADSDMPYAVGTPIVLSHSARRKKLVLNILVDGLSWAVAHPRFPDCMPHIAKFFSHGVIFDQHFSTSEHTYPALPAIETGRYPQHIQIFNEKDSHELPLDCRTLSECMKSLGYYCAAPMASNDSVYCGAMRGYDRLVATSWQLPAYEAAERAIRHMETFNETDQFMLLHVTDVHSWDAKDFKFATSVEARLPLSERLLSIASPAESNVHLPNARIYHEEHWEGLRCADRSIGNLLSYIEDHFDEDEYIVSLYSDHGIPIFSPHDEHGRVDLVGPDMSHAAWMMRGAGVPAAGMVNELTSIVDIYPTLGALCGFPVSPEIDGNLPAVFGGKERDAVYSMSLYPGQTFKLAVRSKTHAFRLETREVVDEDGTVDMADARIGIYQRGYEWKEGYEEDSDELRAFFYPRAREFVREIASNGEHWPTMRAARPQWFGEK